MKKFCTALLLATAACGTASAQYQLANSDFEEWESVTYSGRTGNEPVKWSSFLDGTGNLKSMAGYSQIEKSTEKRSGSNGSYSVKLTSRAVKMMGMTIAVAQGNITTGCINMGSTTASDANGNYNYINDKREDQCPTFTGHPDAVKFWAKFKGNGNYGNVSVYLLTDGYYQDPDEGLKDMSILKATKVAHAKKGDIASNDTWTEIVVPFDYKVDDENPTHLLASFSTCSNPGKGKEADYMFLDDIVMVYNSELKTATYDGADVTFTGTTATVNAEYDENLLSLASNGRAATIERSYDAATGVLTITVKGENISEVATNQHVYTIQFNAPAANPTATMSVSAAAGWGTFCAPFNVEVPSGVTAYTVTGSTDAGVLTLSPVRQLPTTRKFTILANTPVVLKSENGYTNTFEGNAVDGTPVSGLLTGVYLDTPAPRDSYVLQNHDGRVGFYIVDGTTTALPTVGANRCYLTLPAGSNCRALYFDEDIVTALNAAVITDAESTTTFDLQGRRTNAAGQKGMFIVGGKKVIK